MRVFYGQPLKYGKQVLKMYCSKCGQKLNEDAKFCTKCGTPVPGGEAGKGGKTKPPGKQPAKMDVKDIEKKPRKNVSLKESIDFKGAEKALEDGLKTKAFSGIFSSADPSDVRVDSLTKLYEPVHAVRAVYEGEFRVNKEFTLQADPDTVKLKLGGKSYDVKPPESGGGLFGGSSAPVLKLTGEQIVRKRVERGAYYDMKGVAKPNLEQLIKDKPTSPFDPKKEMKRTEVLSTDFDPSGLEDKVMAPDIIQRPQSGKTVSEKITVETLTVYYPKYKAVVTNIKSNQKKTLVISAVNKQTMGGEKF